MSAISLSYRPLYGCHSSMPLFCLAPSSRMQSYPYPKVVFLLPNNVVCFFRRAYRDRILSRSDCTGANEYTTSISQQLVYLCCLNNGMETGRALPKTRAVPKLPLASLSPKNPHMRAQSPNNTSTWQSPHHPLARSCECAIHTNVIPFKITLLATYPIIGS